MQARSYHENLYTDRRRKQTMPITRIPCRSEGPVKNQFSRRFRAYKGMKGTENERYHKPSRVHAYPPSRTEGRAHDFESYWC